MGLVSSKLRLRVSKSEQSALFPTTEKCILYLLIGRCTSQRIINIADEIGCVLNPGIDLDCILRTVHVFVENTEKDAKACG